MIALAILGVALPGLTVDKVKKIALSITQGRDSSYAHCAQYIEAPKTETPVLGQVVITFENKNSCGSSNGILDSVIVFTAELDANDEVTEALREYVAQNTFAPGDVVTISQLNDRS